MLLDFGIARVSPGAGGDPASDDAARCNPDRTLEMAGASGGRGVWTIDGSTLGTPSYMAPEQARAKWSEVDGRSNLWSLGATMFRALTGRPVRRGSSPAEVLQRAMVERAPGVREVAPHVAPEIASIVDCALEHDRDARWQNARAMQTAIRAAAPRAGDAFDEGGAERDSPTLAPTLSPSVVRGSRRRRSSAWLVVAGVAVVASGAVLFSSPRADVAAARIPRRLRAIADDAAARTLVQSRDVAPAEAPRPQRASPTRATHEPAGYSVPEHVEVTVTSPASARPPSPLDRRH